ncbi:MAG: hypothetical protein ABGX83_05390 [Nitrospira sp.]
MAEVTLSSYEIYMAACVGVARRLASFKRGETNKVQNKDFGWHSDIEGACAEMAFAKYLGVFWDGSVNTFKRPDVGNIQVRHTQHERGCLIIRGADIDSQVFVLITGHHPKFEICGWIVGRDAKREEYARDPHGKYPAWFVPAKELRPIAEIRMGK